MDVGSNPAALGRPLDQGAKPVIFKLFAQERIYDEPHQTAPDRFLGIH
jgi:hypothetical protein